MGYPFKNLVFEGGGVKGTAYAGALKVLSEEGITAQIRRVGGSSAGAINAVAFSLGYTAEESADILIGLDFKNFMDDDWGIVRDANRLLTEFGWYKGDFMHGWLRDLIGRKAGNPDATFADLQQKGFRELYLLGTNLSTRFSEVFSAEHTPHMRVADAARISMSFPLFFAAIRMHGDIYVDGGMLNNYPVKLFDRQKYIESRDLPRHSRETDYYAEHNRQLAAAGHDNSPYIYNKETLGFRLNAGQNTPVFREGTKPVSQPIDDFFDYGYAVIQSFLDFQQNQHLHSDDWHRTVYIDTGGVGILDFDLGDDVKRELIASGEHCTRDYLKWFNDTASDPAANHPDVQ